MVQIVITSQFFLEPAVVVVEIVEELGEILREVEERGFDVEVDRLVFGPWCGWSGDGVAGLRFGTVPAPNPRRTQLRSAPRQGLTGNESARIGMQGHSPEGGNLRSEGSIARPGTPLLRG